MSYRAAMRVGQAGPFYFSFLWDVAAAFLCLLTHSLALPLFLSSFPLPFREHKHNTLRAYIFMDCLLRSSTVLRHGLVMDYVSGILDSF